MRLLAHACNLSALLPRRFMTTEAPARTHCPNCGAKLHRQDLSLCAYCATPLTLGGKVEIAGDEVAQRLLRLRDLPAFAPAMTWTPRDPDVEMRAENLRSRGWMLFILAAATLGASTIFSKSFAEPSPLAIVAGVGVLAAFGILAWAAWDRRRALALTLLRRPSLVVSRRSVTAEKAGPSATVYFFTLHFDDASEGEFCWPGQGTMYEPMPNGTTGIAYTRGARLIEFKKL
jgi:hypothetical protein